MTEKDFEVATTAMDRLDVALRHDPLCRSVDADLLESVKLISLQMFALSVLDRYDDEAKQELAYDLAHAPGLDTALPETVLALSERIMRHASRAIVSANDGYELS